MGDVTIEIENFYYYEPVYVLFADIAIVQPETVICFDGRTVEKQKEMVTGDTTDRSHKKKLGLFTFKTLILFLSSSYSLAFSLFGIGASSFQSPCSPV